MKVGSLVYATDQGLGILAKSFFDYGIINDVLVVLHSSRPTHLEWYPAGTEAVPIRGIHQAHFEQATREFCLKQHVMFFFETPFDWSLLPYCHANGIKTILMPMYECMPKEVPFQPTKIIAPSLLDKKHFPGSEFIPVPVGGVAWKQRRRAEVFIHNAGNLGLKGRNGTAQLLQAMKYVRSPIKLIVRYQKDDRDLHTDDSRVELRKGTVPFDELYREGDVFIFPERFNGLSLPLQEARAAGMLVMATDRFPMNTWLPKQYLIPTVGSVLSTLGGHLVEFDEAVIEQRDIAAMIDKVYGQDIAEESYRGLLWSKEMSWETLKPRYMEAIRCA